MSTKIVIKYKQHICTVPANLQIKNGKVSNLLFSSYGQHRLSLSMLVPWISASLKYPLWLQNGFPDTMTDLLQFFLKIDTAIIYIGMKKKIKKTKNNLMELF